MVIWQKYQAICRNLGHASIKCVPTQWLYSLRDGKFEYIWRDCVCVLAFSDLWTGCTVFHPDGPYRILMKIVGWLFCRSDIMHSNRLDGKCHASFMPCIYFKSCPYWIYDIRNLYSIGSDFSLALNFVLAPSMRRWVSILLNFSDACVKNVRAGDFW